ncbi:site-specific integrase [Micromonospora parastrephiae]|uniref:site-specific integrase n=1 Tax=Micromonospora parastrephiae TaxID=2806101 RepID=UPI003898DFDD
MESFLSHLADQRRSPNTVRAYAFDLKDYFAYLTSRGLDWAHLRYDELAGFKPWLRLHRRRVLARLPCCHRWSRRAPSRLSIASWLRSPASMSFTPGTA